MSRFRRLALLGLATAIAGVLAQPSAAARPSLPFTLGTTHFLVHYTGDLTSAAAITQAHAADVGQLAENAYAAETADGYAPPPADAGQGGDDRIDLYVVDLGTGVGGVAVPDNPAAAQTSGYIELNGADPLGLDQHTIAHELFHLIQFGIWNTQAVSDYWLDEATAEWMGFRADGYGSGNGVDVGAPEVSLDCRDPLGTYKCNQSSDYRNDGYVKWPFFEYLAETYGPSFVKDIYAQGAAGAATASDALAAALAAKGTSIASAFVEWTHVAMRGAYTPKLLQGKAPEPYKTVQAGNKAGTVASLSVTVNHLATRYIEFDRGNNDTASQCHPATLTLTVGFPTQTSSLPAFVWKAPDGTFTYTALSASGGTATATVPWDTCTWTNAAGFLALPNGSPTLDTAVFTVTATMTVDGATPAASTAPPKPADVYTQVVPVSSTEQAPEISVFGPELISVGAGENGVRLIVQSNGEGSLVASLGSIALGTSTLRPGANDVRFTLPASLLNSLRRQAGTNQLTLTPVSPEGNVLGAPVLRTVAVAPTVAKKKSKHHK